MFGPERTATGREVDERREAVARRGVEALRQREHGSASGQRARDLGERLRRQREDDQVRLLETCLGDCRSGNAGKVQLAQVARVAARLADRAHLLRVAARERHVVPTIGEQPRERRSPRPPADDGDVHARRTKSIETGTPSSSNRSRSRFSTQ